MLEPIPAEVATAISNVMAGIKTLGKDGTNAHQRYNFVSTDAFLAAVNPLCAAAGMIIIQDEDNISIADKWLTAKYSFILAHKSGATWGPVYRSVMVQANGAQAFGSAQSYALKQFLRSLFQISTGDQDDADQQAAEPLPPKQIARSHANSQPSPAERKAKETAAATFKSAIEMSEDLDELGAWWKKHWPQIDALPDDLKAEVVKAKDACKTHLSKPVLQAAE